MCSDDQPKFKAYNVSISITEPLITDYSGIRELEIRNIKRFLMHVNQSIDNLF